MAFERCDRPDPKDPTLRDQTRPDAPGARADLNAGDDTLADLSSDSGDTAGGAMSSDDFAAGLTGSEASFAASSPSSTATSGMKNESQGGAGHARNRLSSHADETARLAAEARQRAQEKLGQAGEAVRQTAQQAMNQAQQQASRLMEQGQGIFQQQKDRFGGELSGASDAVRQAANRFREENHATIAGYAEVVADQIDSASQYIRERDLPGLLDDAQQFARRRPELFFGGMFLAGLAFARFLKASRPAPEPVYREYDSDYGHAWSESEVDYGDPSPLYAGAAEDLGPGCCGMPDLEATSSAEANWSGSATKSSGLGSAGLGAGVSGVPGNLGPASTGSLGSGSPSGSLTSGSGTGMTTGADAGLDADLGVGLGGGTCPSGAEKPSDPTLSGGLSDVAGTDEDRKDDAKPPLL